MLHVGLDVVLQVLSDARQILHHGNAVLAQMVCRPDAREHQDLRRIDGRRRLTITSRRRTRLLHATALGVLDADGALALEQDAQRQGARLHFARCQRATAGRR